MLANSMGAKGVKVTKTEEIEKALDGAFNCGLDVSFVIDFVMEKDEIHKKNIRESRRNK